MKVKLFAFTTSSSLEEAINLWLNNVGKDTVIKHIKLAITQDTEDVYGHITALILYEETK